MNKQKFWHELSTVKCKVSHLKRGDRFVYQEREYVYGYKLLRTQTHVAFRLKHRWCFGFDTDILKLPKQKLDQKFLKTPSNTEKRVFWYPDSKTAVARIEKQPLPQPTYETCALIHRRTK